MHGHRPQRIELLRNGEVPIHEPGLSALIHTNVQARRLLFSTDAAQTVAFADLLFIAVGTPGDEDGSADLQYVLAVARNIGQHMQGYKVIVDKSTVPVGTGEKVQASIRAALADRGVQLPFEVCSNPEFMKEGAAIDDFTRGARIIVGTGSDAVKALMRECYAPITAITTN